MIKIPLLARNESIMPVVYAMEGKYFEKYKLDVVLDFHENIWEDTKGFIEGDYKFVRGDFTRYLSFKNDGIDLIISHDFTRDFKLISKVPINTIDEINEKEVLISKGTSIEFYLDLFLEAKKVSLKKVDIKEIIQRYEEFLKNDSIQLIMLPDPFARKLLENGCYLVHDITTTDINIKGYMWHKKYYLENQEFVTKFFEAINEATKRFNELGGETQIFYLKKYDMIDSDKNFKHRTYELSHPFSEKSYAIAEKWFKENRGIE